MMRILNSHIRFVRAPILFAILCVLLAACHKDTGDKGPRLVKTMSIDGNPCAISCIYDNESRIISVTQCDTVESYTYSGDSVVYVRMIGTGIAYKYIYRLNENGIATGYTRVASDGSLTEYALTYDSDKNRTGLTDNTHANTFINYLIQANNAVYDSSVSAVINAGNYTIRRTYYANTENTISYANFGKAFLGSSSANFKKTESFSTPDGQYMVSYTYELDYLNGVSRRIMKVNDSITESRDYEYFGSD